MSDDDDIFKSTTTTATTASNKPTASNVKPEEKKLASKLDEIFDDPLNLFSK